jgi:hypothetical protein
VVFTILHYNKVGF